MSATISLTTTTVLLANNNHIGCSIVKVCGEGNYLCGVGIILGIIGVSVLITWFIYKVVG